MVGDPFISHEPDLPGVRPRNVNLAVVVPEGLRVVPGKVEMDGVGPGHWIVRVLALEDDLQYPC